MHSGIAGRFLPAEGVEVEWSAWWARRVSDGSAVLTDPAKATKPSSPQSSEPNANFGDGQ
jgi:hypothetical protein